MQTLTVLIMIPLKLEYEAVSRHCLNVDPLEKSCSEIFCASCSNTAIYASILYLSLFIVKYLPLIHHTEKLLSIISP